MLVDVKPPQTADAALARDRVRIGPVPAWVVSCPFDPGFKPAQTEHLTYLLDSRQAHAEHRQMHVHTAVRLETMQAVQHESQWRLQFEPRTQSVTLHWIKIRRGDREFDHTTPEAIHVLQREEGLEGWIIDGRFTLLLLLADVRPGDVLEACYTIETHPRLLPEHCAFFFSLPQGIPVGKFRYSLLFNEGRPMKWKSSDTKLTPEESRENGEALWVWSGENYAGAKPETNTVEWHIAYPWLQFSDCPDWGTVASGFFNAWNQENDDNTVAEMAQEIAGSEPEILARVEKAIQLVQDEYRYLSVDLELGGQVPAAPGVVARRRFGDCKDLSFLLVHLLKCLGVSARPVLVNTSLRKSILGMLPMPGLFNHALVEYQVRDQTCWVDPTVKRQGGGALNRVLPDYGAGLPIAAGSSRLVPPPIRSSQSGLYELRETILLDTTGAPSLLAVTVKARDGSAEALRQQFEVAGAEEVARERLQICANRFVSATRMGALEYRDDRAANEFLLAEVFEINGFLAPHESAGCRLSFPANLVVSTLQMPEARPDKTLRQTPFALPHPCNIVHIIEVQSIGLQLTNAQRRKLSSPYLQFSCTEKTASGFWSVTLSLSTLADAVPPERIEEHRKLLQQIWQESNWQIVIPLGYAHTRKRNDFGKLPPPPLQPGTPLSRQSAPLVSAPAPAEAPHPVAPASVSSSPSNQPAHREPQRESLDPGTTQIRRGHRRRKRSRNRKGKKLLLPMVLGGILLLVIILFAVGRKLAE